jgi:hypothetical protein
MIQSKSAFSPIAGDHGRETDEQTFLLAHGQLHAMGPSSSPEATTGVTVGRPCVRAISRL